MARSYHARLCMKLATLLMIVSASASMVHPGALESQDELDFVKMKIAAGAEPWVTQFQRAKGSGAANRTPNGGQATLTPDGSNMQNDAEGAYIQALLWHYTDNEAYAKGAIAILNSWTNLQSINSSPTPSQGNLCAGWIGAVMAPAAELMRSYKEWKNDDREALGAMFKRVFYPWLNKMSYWNGNVDLTQIDAMLSIAVFTDDQYEFDAALKRLDKRMPAYFFLPPKPVPAIDGDGGNPQAFYSNPTKWVPGLTQETCRDNGHHAQFALGSAIHAAEVAFHQGTDVYSKYQERLTTAMELMALQFNSGDMQGTCSDDSPTADRFSTWEIGYSHYHYIAGVSLPETEKLIVSAVRTRGQSVLNLVWESFTHADLNLNGTTPTPTPTPTPVPTPKPTTTPTPTPAPTPGPPGTCSKAYDQCGGGKWKGPLCCAKGYTCKAENEYYFQCIPNTQNSKRLPGMDFIAVVSNALRNLKMALMPSQDGRVFEE